MPSLDSQCEMAPSAYLSFISLVTSCDRLEEEDPTYSLPHVLYVGLSDSLFYMGVLYSY